MSSFALLSIRRSSTAAIRSINRSLPNNHHYNEQLNLPSKTINNKIIQEYKSILFHQQQKEVNQIITTIEKQLNKKVKGVEKEVGHSREQFMGSGGNCGGGGNIREFNQLTKMEVGDKNNLIGYQMMNRNARKPNKANHGKRPCSRYSRRAKRSQYGNPRRK